TVVLDQPFQRFPREIETVESRIRSFKMSHDAQGLRIVVEATELHEAGVERAFARMAERRVAEIVSERQSLAQILVEPKRARQRARDLRNFKRVRQARAVMVALMKDEYLRLMGEAPERGGMDDTVAIAPESVARSELQSLPELVCRPLI